MTKRQIIDEIIDSNPSAEPGFLAQFEQNDLLAYLRKLHILAAPRLISNVLESDLKIPELAALAISEPTTVDVPAEPVAPAPCPATQASQAQVDLYPLGEESVAVQEEEFEYGLYELVIEEEAPVVEPVAVAASDDVDEEKELVLTDGSTDSFEQESWLF